VTGAAEFVGSLLVERLLARGHVVGVFDRPAILLRAALI